MADGEGLRYCISKDEISFYGKSHPDPIALDNHEWVFDIPDLVFDMVHLKKFMVIECLGLTSIPESLSRLVNLEDIRLRRMEQLTCLPGSIGSLTHLSILSLHHCNLLTCLPGSIGSLNELSILNLHHCNLLTCLPSSVENMYSLRILTISNCNGLTFSESMRMPASLMTLSLSECVSVVILPGALNFLSKLEVSECINLVKLPEGMDSLEVLSLMGLHTLSEIPILPKKLSEFTMYRCTNIKSLDSSFRNVTGLTCFDVRGCHGLTSIPGNIRRSINLKTLVAASCGAITELPESIGELSSLERLIIHGSTSIKRIPSSFYRCVKCNRIGFGFGYLEYPPPHIVKMGAENIRRFLYYHDDKAKIFMAALSKRHRLPSELWHLIYNKFVPAKIHGCNALKQCEDLPFILKISGYDNLFLGCRRGEIDVSKLIGVETPMSHVSLIGNSRLPCSRLVKLYPGSKVKYRVRDGVEVDLPMFEIQ